MSSTSIARKDWERWKSASQVATAWRRGAHEASARVSIRVSWARDIAAGERRTRKDNEAMAVRRLRLNLALHHRSPVTDERFVAVDDVKAALDDGRKMIIVDARAHADFVDGHIVGSVSIPFYELEQIIDDLPQDVWIVNYCGCPHTVSGLNFDAMKEAGFEKVAVLDEGYYIWEERGYPIEPGE